MTGRPLYRCQYCYDRRYIILHRRGSSAEFHDCKHCDGTYTVSVDGAYREALDWFKTAPVPDGGFKIGRHDISDAKAYWAKLRSCIAQDNIYVLERIRDEIIGLKILFDGCDL